jgi:hypothetical protein
MKITINWKNLFKSIGMILILLIIVILISLGIIICPIITGSILLIFLLVLFGHIEYDSLNKNEK